MIIERPNYAGLLTTASSLMRSHSLNTPSTPRYVVQAAPREKQRPAGPLKPLLDSSESGNSQGEQVKDYTSGEITSSESASSDGLLDEKETINPETNKIHQKICF